MKGEIRRSRVGSERTKQPAPPKTLLDYDMQQAKALGYGCHYGDYKADHPNTRAEFERLTDGVPQEPKLGPGVRERKCARCGGTFYISTKHEVKYCSPECKHEAQKERDAAYKRKGKMMACKTCGKTFQSYRGTRYCCAECMNIGQRENQKALRKKYKQEAKNNADI